MTNPRRVAVTWLKEQVAAVTDTANPLYGVTVVESIHEPLEPRAAGQFEFLRPFYMIDAAVTPDADGLPVYKDIALALAAYVRIESKDKRERLTEQDRAMEIFTAVFGLIFDAQQAGTKPAGVCRWYVAGVGEADDNVGGNPYAVVAFALVINPTIAGVDWRQILKAAGALP